MNFEGVRIGEIHFESVAPFAFLVKVQDEVTREFTEIFNPAKLGMRKGLT